MQEDWKISVMVPIYKEKDVTYCKAYRGVRLLEHRMKSNKEKDKSIGGSG